MISTASDNDIILFGLYFLLIKIMLQLVSGTDTVCTKHALLCDLCFAEIWFLLSFHAFVESVIHFVFPIRLHRKQRNGSESEYTEKLQQYSKSLSFFFCNNEILFYRWFLRDFTIIRHSATDCWVRCILTSIWWDFGRIDSLSLFLLLNPP